MKNFLLVTLLLSMEFTGLSQGLFVYDQQSSTTIGNAGGGGGAIQNFSPLGQSFTPGLSEIDFVELAFYDYQTGNDLGATVYVNLRSDSITGPIIGTTGFVSMPDGFGIGGLHAASSTFTFPTPLALAVGTTYYLEVVEPSGDLFGASAGEYLYQSGVAYSQGVAHPGSDLWFREGILAPEPSAGALTLLGAGALWWFRRKRAAI